MIKKKQSKKHIKLFFKTLAFDRNKKINNNPIVKYEQLLRARNAIKLLNPLPCEKILDLGCGNGRDIIEIAKIGSFVYGIDFSEEMISEAYKEIEKTFINNASIKLSVSDISSLKFPNNYFDKIICSEVLEHVPDLDLAIKEIKRVLKPDGILVITTPNKNSWYGFDRYFLWQKLLKRKWPHPYDRWTNKKNLVNLLDSNKFTIELSYSVCFIPGFIFPYFLPNIAKKFLVFIVSKFEIFLQYTFPLCGYTLCFKARNKKK